MELGIGGTGGIGGSVGWAKGGGAQSRSYARWLHAMRAGVPFGESSETGSFSDPNVVEVACLVVEPTGIPDVGQTANAVKPPHRSCRPRSSHVQKETGAQQDRGTEKKGDHWHNGHGLPGQRKPQELVPSEFHPEFDGHPKERKH